MSFNFKHKSEDELQEIRNQSLQIWPVGIQYQFEVKAFNPTIFQNSGNSGVKMVLEIYNAEGGLKNIEALLIDMDKMLWQTKAFCDSVGHPEWYENDSIPEDKVIGARGILTLGIKKGAPNSEEGGFYPDKNVVKSYIKGTGNFIPEKSSTVKATMPETADTFADDISF